MLNLNKKDVDGRDEPGHDERRRARCRILPKRNASVGTATDCTGWISEPYIAHDNTIIGRHVAVAEAHN